jgi:O-antigen/teichoic acid export membrane protein
MICALTVYQITAAVAATLFIPAMAAQRMIWPAFAELAARAIAFSVAGFAVGVGQLRLAPALLGYPAAALIWLTVAIVCARRFAPELRLSITSAGAGRIVRILWSFALLEIFAQMFARIGVIVLALKVGDAAAGIFGTGLRLIEVALMPLSFLGVAAYPNLSRLYSTSLPAFRESSGDLMWLMLLGGGIAAWGLYFIAPPLLVPVLGPRFAGAEPVIQTMAVFALVQAIEVCLGRILLCADRQIPNAVFVACGAVVSLALNLWWVPRFGVTGAVYAGAAAYALIDALGIAALWRTLTGPALLRMFLALGGAVAAAAGVAMLLARCDFSRVLQAIASALALALLGGVILRRRVVGAA